MTTDATIIDTAIDWHLRQAEMTADDWMAFVTWLEADPAHAAAFDRVAMVDRAIPPAPAPAPLEAANDDAAPVRRWRGVIGGSVAAAVAAALLAPVMLAQRPDPYSVETAAGERRVVALGDGTRIEMSGGTRLTLDHHDDRVAALDRGQALFTVRHDAAHPFTLTAGGVAVRDLGTVFDVARDGPRLAVQVASGSVMVQPDRDRITLTPGQTLLTDEASGHAVRGTVAPADVGGWRQGRIALTGATLGDLASAWRRLYGTRLNLTGALAQRPFTGMVALTGKAERDVPHVAALIGADWRRNGEDWIIEAPGGSSR
ncbi:FecR domain-containing protein [Sphingomonas pseudosanguinis]|uniref:Transmembrane sensor n=1 Tax=Sphingomonas pseudosanguinis TaxID=413712 RepID=A0A7W6F4H9_9SPHN|nr:transmembrane sensor [Sphingomonas pseudosanguinis]MBN3535339.1 FecR domain-containing protein [Sphingomonas pseudosanguinis]